MEVSSPGGVVPPVTEAILRARAPAHASRNPMLVRALAGAGYLRDEGEGIPRMFDERTAKSLPAPEIFVEHGLFVVRLRNAAVGEAAGEPPPSWPSFRERRNGAR